MPINEYICSNCHNNFEIIQKINAKKLVKCFKCKKHTLKKNISPTSFILKGTGWYETDFKHKK